jgi:twinfilin
MLYASTRNSLMKSLGATHFVDTLFATSKSDLTPDAYAAHLRHTAAPKPISTREQELEGIKAEERLSGRYEDSRTRKSHVQGVGMTWNSEVENALKEVSETENKLMIVVGTIRISDTRIRMNSHNMPDN